MSLHPDLAKRCRCGFRAVEHDGSYGDLRCPGDDFDAIANRREWDEEPDDVIDADLRALEERWGNEHDIRKDEGTHNRR